MRHTLATTALLLVSASAFAGQPPAPGWTLTYSVSGGIAGLSRTVSVTEAGRIQVDDRKVGRLDAAMDRDLFVRARDAVAAAKEVSPTRRAPYPDEIVSSLTLTSNGRTRDVEMTPELLNALGRGADVALWQTLVGSWRQVGLTYCSPKAHLSPEDVEPAIETLAFNGDGSFTVRWPGDAHASAEPHVSLPGLRGAFRASLTGGGLEITAADGEPVPRDFAGTGTFRFEGERRLLLRGLWFGTRSVTAKPDVCELVFEKA
jgi:hypothetical protein